MHLFMLWVDQLERSFLEKALGVLVDTKVNMCPWGKSNQQYHGLHYAEHCQQVEGADISSLLSPGETRLDCWVQI